ncbi:uncharacterized protein LOC117972317 [Acipenser ruthenus]|uniref:uncharacterized protein LOC117972317 n=1 Tax=Acipenser ruthenus TaxID=7906 RepID=UPI002741FCFB|nr:uncharacterized protein LOC117972317 [Acipenser ruthenus]
MPILSTNYDRILLLGDFNLHIDNKADSKAIDFLRLLDSLDFIQHVSGPTDNHGHTLDLVISRGLVVNISSIIDPNISDHSCILFEAIVSVPRKSGAHTIKSRVINSSTVQRFSEIISSAPSLPLQSLSTELLVDRFNHLCTTTLHTVAPVKTRLVPLKHNAPWINNTIRQIKRDCRKMERKWRATKLHIYFDIMKDYLSRYNEAIRSARCAYFSKLIEENKNNSRVLFSTIDNLINPSFSPICNIEVSSSKCEEFLNYFENKIKTIREQIPSYGSNLIISDRLGKTVMKSFSCITAQELNMIVMHMKSTTCMLDPIPTRFLKDVLSYLCNDILAIMNSSLENGIVPASFKIALVKPLLKKPNLDSSLLSNFRPISNLPFLAKVLEKVVLKQLNGFLITNNMFEKFQSGFRSNHSTETALVRVTNDLLMSADSNAISILVLLDLSAAFDTVDHSILIDRLKGWVGLDGKVLNWFRSYLTNRQFFVSLGESVGFSKYYLWCPSVRFLVRYYSLYTCYL